MYREGCVMDMKSLFTSSSLRRYLLLTIFTFSVFFTGCGGGYNLTQFENAPRLGSSQPENLGSAGEEYANTILDVVKQALLVAHDQNGLKNVDYYKVIEAKFSNHKKVEYYQYSAINLVEGIKKDIGTITDVVDIDRKNFIYLVKASDGPRIIYVDDDNNATLFNFK